MQKQTRTNSGDMPEARHGKSKNKQQKDTRFTSGPAILEYRAAINRGQGLFSTQQLPRLRSEVPLSINREQENSANTFLPKYFKTQGSQNLAAANRTAGKSGSYHDSRRNWKMGNTRKDEAFRGNENPNKTTLGSAGAPPTSEGNHSPPPPPPPPPPENNISLADIMLKLNSLVGIPNQINDIANDLKQIKVIQEQTAKLSQEIIEVQGQVNMMDQKISKIQDNETETQQTLQFYAREISDLKAEVKQLKQLQQDSKSAPLSQSDFELLKVKADMKKNNLIIEGLREPQDDRDHAAYYQARSFLKNTMGITYAEIDRAYRLGKPRNKNSQPRPLLIRFTRLGDRMDVWDAR